jgi:hypothetical protein
MCGEEYKTILGEKEMCFCPLREEEREGKKSDRNMSFKDAYS